MSEVADLFANTPAGTSRALDLNNPTDRKRLADQIKADIDDYAVATYNNGHRNHLGASEIGDVCGRRIWSKWRWLRADSSGKDGRMQRLFQRGHLEEHRFIEYLRGIGFTVWDQTEDGKQFRISAVGGHFGGALDGMASAPIRYNISEPLIFLNEFKTQGTGRKFVELGEKGVAIVKNQHYIQMNTYAPHYNIRFGLYMVVNKNDDTLYVEIVPLDWTIREDIERKAEHIIRSQVPPSRCSESPAYMECKTCTFTGLCFHGHIPEKNCRSCPHASPVPGGEWFCVHWNGVIPKDVIPLGCNDWRPLING